MQRDLVVKSRNLGGSSDLTLLAPIRPGFVESLDSVTYKTRVKRVLDTLHGARALGYEHHQARLLSDSIERVGAIVSVRVCVLEPEDKVLLVVTFDGNWRQYIRILWAKVGTLLDLIFCGTVDYVTAFDHTFDQWCDWVHLRQVETRFFYGPAEGTAKDTLYWRRVEQMQLREMRGAGTTQPSFGRASLPAAEDRTERLIHPPGSPPPCDEPIQQPGGNPLKGIGEHIKSGFRGLAGLYRLADIHRPGTPDGEVLRRAAVDLLREFVQRWQWGLLQDSIDFGRLTRFPRQIAWLFPDGVPPHVNEDDRRLPPDPADDPPIPAAILAEVQAGILRPLNGITAGLMLLVAWPDAATGKALFDMLVPLLQKQDGPLYTNLALTPAGLRACGLDEDTLALFPEDFLQGMAARCGLLGDVRNNHPRRWRLPQRAADPSERGRVALPSVHAVLQFRWGTGEAAALQATALAGLRAIQGLELLAEEPLTRRYRAGDIIDHFDYADGNGQPEFEAGGFGGPRNRVHLGEVLIGEPNAADFSPAVDTDRRWLARGSFLALRKYRQFPDLLEAAVDKTALQMATAFKGYTGPAIDFKELVYAKLMGRFRDGRPITAPNAPGRNDFDYSGDPQGSRCPLHAHIRLTHPRSPPIVGGRPPRIVRRGMSYGPADASDTPRGLMFMAYCASLSEQYEVAQRWLTGANSTGASSTQACPIVGVPQYGHPRSFTFEHTMDLPGGPLTQAFTVVLDAAAPLFDEPESPTRLEWGLYLFAPALPVLADLHQQLKDAVPSPGEPVPWELARGRVLLAALQRLERERGEAEAVQAWKAAVEDPEAIDRLDAAAVWAAIRADHGGLLRTPYGVIVASREAIRQVLTTAPGRYSISGQRARMIDCFGDIYLGMDEGPQYRAEADPVNAVMPARASEAFDTAFAGTNTKLKQIKGLAVSAALAIGDSEFDTDFELREIVDEVAADLCETWFGIQAYPALIARGSVDWNWREGQPPLYPGHFMALSRYMFQPVPGPMVGELSRRFGRGLMAAFTKIVAEVRKTNPQAVPQRPNHGGPAPIAQAIFQHPLYGQDDAWVARTMLGIMMGFIAPLVGAAMNVLREWQRDGSFHALRAELAGRSDATSVQAVVLPALMRALKMRPMPQIIWRTVLREHALGDLDLVPGDVLVLGLVSGTQQSIGDGQPDHALMFGGERDWSGANQPPAHACPGRDPALMALLGLFGALLVRDEQLIDGMAPMGFTMQGPCVSAPAAAMSAQNSQARQAAAAPAAGSSKEPEPDLVAWPPVLPQGRQGLIVVAGDSWLDGPYQATEPWWGSDLSTQLAGFGWTVPTRLGGNPLCDYQRWGQSRQFDARAKELAQTIASLLAQAQDPKAPMAILLSGGGDDSTGNAFSRLLDLPATGNILNDAAVKAHMDMLRGFYDTALTEIGKRVDKRVPLIVHGYDFPKMPTNPQSGNLGWFRLPYDRAGYPNPADRVAGLKILIRKFNEMLAELPQTYPNVRHVDLSGTIERLWSDPQQGWIDDLHTRRSALLAYALKIDAAIVAPA